MKDDLLTAVGGFIFALLGAFALVAVSATWNGYALSVLWGWFLVPVFKVPALSVPYAIGLALVASYLTHQHVTRDDEKFAAVMVRALLKPVLALLVGWIVLKFI